MPGFSVCPKCFGPKDKRAKHCLQCREHIESPVQHGEVRCYYRGCRCNQCRRANADYAKLRKLRNPEQIKKEQRRYWARNKERLNTKRRFKHGTLRAFRVDIVKRRYRKLGALVDRLPNEPIRSKYLVYALVDPRDLATRYVGVSSSGLARPKQHGQPSVLAMQYNKRKDDWIKELQAAGLYYAIRVIEYADSPEEAHVKEPYWINWFRSIGEHLYNLTTGDDTQIRASEETKEKMRKAMLGRVITWGDKISATKRAKK